VRRAAAIDGLTGALQSVEQLSLAAGAVLACELSGSLPVARWPVANLRPAGHVQ
jgi:hypothetical protein